MAPRRNKRNSRIRFADALAVDGGKAEQRSDGQHLLREIGAALAPLRYVPTTKRGEEPVTKKLKTGKKLSLNKKTLRSLEGGELKKVAGGDETIDCGGGGPDPTETVRCGPPILDIKLANQASVFC